MIVRYTRRAQNDLEKILKYLDERSPQGARNVKVALRRTIDTIVRHPDIGHATGRDAARGVPVGRYPYLVYWTVEGDEVRLVHIRHAARKPWHM
jgi:plasmid stabilization system protein ParE